MPRRSSRPWWRPSVAGRQEGVDVPSTIFLRCVAGELPESLGMHPPEVQAARSVGLDARLLIPLTRGEGGAALQFEVELTSFDQLDQFRQSGSARTTRRLGGCTTSVRSSYLRLRSRFCASIFRGDWCSRGPAVALYWRLLGRRGGDVNRAVAAAAATDGRGRNRPAGAAVRPADPDRSPAFRL